MDPKLWHQFTRLETQDWVDWNLKTGVGRNPQVVWTIMFQLLVYYAWTARKKERNDLAKALFFLVNPIYDKACTDGVGEQPMLAHKRFFLSRSIGTRTHWTSCAEDERWAHIVPLTGLWTGLCNLVLQGLSCPLFRLDVKRVDPLPNSATVPQPLGVPYGFSAGVSIEKVPPL